MIPLCLKEGWEVDGSRVYACGKEFKLQHPYLINLKLYRDSDDVDVQVNAMHRAHDLLWPHHAGSWHRWTERRFTAHCMGATPLIFASGAATGKSLDAAKIALLFWLSDPKNNSCIVTSVTLESLESRIWGYVASLFSSAVLPIPGTFLTSKPPKILYPKQKEKIHGLFAAAIKMGDDIKTLSTIIGRHPNKRLLVILDECTDMTPNVLKAIPNLEQGVDTFQLIGIGNSNSKTDLHGALATPRRGWKTVDPMRDYTWETQYENGLCLYFNPYDSPAISETDVVKKEVLSRFLITTAGIEKKKREYGEESDSFYRFVLGFWQDKQMDNTIISEPFLNEHQVRRKAEWSGFYPKEVVAGLDPAFQIGGGGAGCILRLGVLGHTVDGLVVLDFRGEDLIHKIDLVRGDASGEMQIATQVLAVLERYNCPVSNLAIDATGIGRALGELIRIVSKQEGQPYRVVSVKPRSETLRGKVDPFVLVMSPSDMWLKFREFVQQDQIRGIDSLTAEQLVNRKVLLKGGHESPKLMLESKADYKARMAAINPKLAKSPDESDAMMLAMQVAIWRLGFAPGQRRVMTPTTIIAQKEAAYVSRGGAITATTIISKPPLVANFSTTLEDAV